MKIFFTSALLLAFISVYSQTPVNGGIYSNTTWTLANSPYIMTGNIVVFPGVTLNIEAGVDVRVKESAVSGNGYSLETRGTVNMIGKANQLIKFCADSAITSTSAWKGFFVKNSQGGVLNYNYVSISNAINAIIYDGTIPSLIRLNDCIFKFNGYAVNVGRELIAENCYFKGNDIGVYGWSIFKFTNCTFDSNSSAVSIYASELMVRNCSFTKNIQGINLNSGSVNVIEVKNCEFDNNAVAIVNANNGILDSCTFTNNGEGVVYTTDFEIKNSLFNTNKTALQVGWGTTVSNCEIRNNETGVALGPIGFGQPAPIIENNEICYNSKFNIDNRTDLNLSIPTNCFCSTDSTIIEAKIFDGYDDITKGLISYAIYNANCSSIASMVNKTGFITSNNEIPEIKISFFPNPVVNNLTVNNENAQHVEIIDLQGKLVLLSKLKDGYNLIDITYIPQGIYFLRFSGTGNEMMYKRIVKI